MARQPCGAGRGAGGSGQELAHIFGLQGLSDGRQACGFIAWRVKQHGLDPFKDLSRRQTVLMADALLLHTRQTGGVQHGVERDPSCRSGRIGAAEGGILVAFKLFAAGDGVVISIGRGRQQPQRVIRDVQNGRLQRPRQRIQRLSLTIRVKVRDAAHIGAIDLIGEDHSAERLGGGLHLIAVIEIDGREDIADLAERQALRHHIGSKARERRFAHDQRVIERLNRVRAIVPQIGEGMTRRIAARMTV